MSLGQWILVCLAGQTVLVALAVWLVRGRR